ncbi:hypothetical protein C3E99_00690 [Sphingopyxis sp. MG]|nr:hypothetical protein C3E99_00690 [Sphingopyxis sp. MG]ODU29700.1 MAG: hypothetical protein ABS88_07695 [Sphingopyxis sp. SCN 67-31]
MIANAFQHDEVRKQGASTQGRRLFAIAMISLLSGQNGTGRRLAARFLLSLAGGDRVSWRVISFPVGER